jgi:low affinity Fe/Cu permease
MFNIPGSVNPAANWFSRFSKFIASITGQPLTFSLACLVVLAWAVTGPLFHYSDTWQLFINTGTTIITFLMVFLIQNSQNRDSAAIQLKLNEIILCLEGASNHIIDAEEKTLDELEEMKKGYQEVAKLAHEEIARELVDDMEKIVEVEQVDEIEAVETARSIVGAAISDQALAHTSVESAAADR